MGQKDTKTTEADNHHKNAKSERVAVLQFHETQCHNYEI